MSIENRLAALDLASRIVPKDCSDFISSAAAILSWLENGIEPTTQTATTPAADPPRGRGRPRKVSVTEAEKATATEAEYVEPTEAEPEAPAPVEQPPRQEVKTPLKTSATREVIKQAIENAIKAGVRDDVKRIFGKYGVTNLTGLKEDKYGEFMADLDTAVLNA